MKKYFLAVLLLTAPISSAFANDPTLAEVIERNQGAVVGKWAWSEEPCRLETHRAWPPHEGLALLFQTHALTILTLMSNPEWSIQPMASTLEYFDIRKPKTKVTFFYDKETLRIYKYAVTAGDTCILP